MSIIPFRKNQGQKKQPTKIDALIQFSREIDTLFSQYANNGFEPKDLLIILSNRLGAFLGHYMIADPTMYKIMSEQIKTKSNEEAQRRCQLEGVPFNAPE